jgi:hypothetical protein
MRWRAHSHCSRKIRRSAISCPSGLSWSCRMKSARTSLGDVRTRRRSRRAAGPSASARRAASSQNTGARAYQWPGPEAAHATRMYISTEAGWSKGYLDLPIYSTSQRHIVLAARVGVRLRSDRALTGRAATRIIDPCARKRPVATCFGAPRLVGGFLRARPWLPRRARWGTRHTARLRRDPRGDVRRPELGRGTRRFRARLRLADRRRRPRCTAPTRSIGSPCRIPNAPAV